MWLKSQSYLYQLPCERETGKHLIHARCRGLWDDVDGSHIGNIKTSTGALYVAQVFYRHHSVVSALLYCSSVCVLYKSIYGSKLNLQNKAQFPLQRLPRNFLVWWARGEVTRKLRTCRQFLASPRGSHGEIGRVWPSRHVKMFCCVGGQVVSCHCNGNWRMTWHAHSVVPPLQKALQSHPRVKLAACHQQVSDVANKSLHGEMSPTSRVVSCRVVTLWWKLDWWILTGESLNSCCLQWQFCPNVCQYCLSFRMLNVLYCIELSQYSMLHIVPKFKWDYPCLEFQSENWQFWCTCSISFVRCVCVCVCYCDSGLIQHTALRCRKAVSGW